MTWTRLSDDFTDRPQVLDLSRSARLLHIEALIYCNKHLTDGRLPVAALRRITDSDDLESDIKQLTEAGLWEADGLAFQIDWAGQEAGEEVRQRQVYQAEKQKRYRDRKSKHDRGEHDACDPRYCKAAVTGNETSNVTGLVTPSRPVPSRPVPKGQGQGQGAAVAGAPPALSTGAEASVAHLGANGPLSGHGFTGNDETDCDRCHLPRHNPRHA